MFPTLSIRLLVTATILLGSWVLASAAPALIAGDGSAGFSLVMARSGLLPALLVVLLAAIPVIGMSLVCSSLGNPLSGLFALATAMWVLSAQGETIDGWIRRTDANLPSDYLRLSVEVLFWFSLLAGFLALLVAVRPAVRRMLPMLAREPHLGEEITLSRKWLPAMLSALITAIIAGVLASFLLRTPDKGQIIGGLIMSFMIASLIGDMATTFLFQKHPANPMASLIAPMLVAITGYCLAGVRFGDEMKFLEAYYETSAAGLALALPLDYASAGVAGCALGTGWSQVMLSAEESQTTG